MRYTELIGTHADYIEHQSIKPLYPPCPQCDTRGKRKRVLTRCVAHGAALPRRSWIVAEVGVSQARCDCCTYCQAPMVGVPSRGRDAFEVRNTGANAVMRDRMPSHSVMNRRQEDYRLTLSLGSVHACFLWAHEQITMERHWECGRANFSGVLCIDAGHDRGRTIVFATDPLGDCTVSFTLVDRKDQDHLHAFLHALTDRQLDVQVAMTDGSPLYKDSRQRSWSAVEQQRWVFHVIKDVNTRILDGVRAINNRIKRQGNTGRKKRRGRPRKQAQQQRQSRQGMRKKEQAAFLWEHQYLMGRKHQELSTQDKTHRTLMLKIAPDLTVFRTCNQQCSRLFEQGIRKQCARVRRTRLVNHASYHANAFLARALKQLSKDQCDHMIVFLGWEHSQRTNNHVERNNRGFRMMQKTRYKRRKTHTMTKALELALYARMLKHPLYLNPARASPSSPQETDTLLVAA